MSRCRNIKPALFENEILGQMPGDTVLCFAGLWCLADREGRLEDRPMRIKAKIFPYRDVVVEEALKQLSEGGFIIRYQIGNDAFIQVVNFLKHQHPHHKEQGSVIPASSNLPTKASASTDLTPTKESACPSDSLIPHTDSLILIPSSPNGESGGVESSDEDKASKPRRAKASNDEDADFTAFWDAYPKKIAKPKALAAWRKAKLPAISDILASIASQSASEQWRKNGGQFIPHPATWINGERWNDSTSTGRESDHADF